MRCLYVYNKIDMTTIEECDRILAMPDTMVLSCQMKLNLDLFLDKIWSSPPPIQTTPRDRARSSPFLLITLHSLIMPHTHVQSYPSPSPMPSVTPCAVHPKLLSHMIPHHLCNLPPVFACYTGPRCFIPITAAVETIHSLCGVEISLDLGREYLGLVRVYTKPRGKKPDFNDPLVLTEGRYGITVEAACKQIHRTLLQSFDYAIVWGLSVKHTPQRCGLAHTLSDEDVIQANGANQRW